MSFSLNDGLAVVLFEHSGSSNFQVSLEGPSEQPALINEIGSVDGATAFAAEEGDYLADINADGEWSLTVVQPLAAPEAIRTPPVQATGQGQDVIGPVELDGGVTVSGEHTGDSNFQVVFFTETAAGFFGGQTIVFNELGEFEGETRADADGVIWVNINADGEWSIEIE